MSPFQNVRRNLENIKLNNKRINAICHISPKESLLNQSIASSERWKNGTQKSTIDGMTMVIKDNICTTDLPTSCASKMLQGYISPFDATVVKLLKEAGVIIIGKSNMDEFGMGYLLII